jgi:hypothetical protein
VAFKAAFSLTLIPGVDATGKLLFQLLLTRFDRDKNYQRVGISVLIVQKRMALFMLECIGFVTNIRKVVKNTTPR